MPASALLLGASVASLNLCADEYLLLLARPGEIASVSFLSQDPRESPLWHRARRHHANRGSIEDVLTRKPKAIFTMGGGGRSTALIARRLGIRAIDLKPTGSLDDVASNLRIVASTLGEPSRAAPWIARLDALRRSSPRSGRDTIFLSGTGDSLSPRTAGVEWLRLAGLDQRPLAEGRATLETLLTRPPQVLVGSNYRLGQVSRGARWLDHPVVRRMPSRRIMTDGRAWTCMGPLMILEIERLRKIVQ